MLKRKKARLVALLLVLVFVMPAATPVFAITSIEVTFSARAGGSITSATTNATTPLISGETVDEFDVLDFVAAPNPGFYISGWLVNGIRSTGYNYSPNFSIVAGDMNLNIEAVFELVTLTFTSGSNGAISAAIGSQPNLTSPASVAPDATVTFTATPNLGFRVDGWYINGTRQAVADGSLTLSRTTTGIVSDMPALLGENITVNVTFAPIPAGYHEVRFGVLNNQGGNIGAVMTTSPESTPGVIGVVHPIPTEITFTATPSPGTPGWRVRHWLINGAPYNRPAGTVFTANVLDSYTLNAHTQVEVVFERLAIPQVMPSPRPIAQGGTLSLSAALYPGPDNLSVPGGVTWTISDSQIGSVNANGLLTVLPNAQEGSSFYVTATTIAGAQISASIAMVVELAQVSGVTVTPVTATINRGGNQQFTAATVPANRAVNWTITPSNIPGVSISAGGLVTVTNAALPDSLTPTNFTVTATSVENPTESDTATFTVPATVPSITGDVSNLFVGQARPLTVSGLAGPFTWTFSPTGIVSVSDASGVPTLTALAQGSTIVTVTAAGGSSANLNVTVGLPPITITPAGPINLTLGAPQQATQQLTASLPAGATAPGFNNITWTSSNNNIATISANGLVTAVSAGTVTITATSQGAVTAAVTVNVSPAPAPSLTIDQGNIVMNPGQLRQLSATLTGATGNIIWSVSPANIVSVNASGLVTANNIGTATITATSGNLSASVVVTVTTVPQWQNFSVTVSNSHAHLTGTGAGVYTSGQFVQIHAGSRTGYTFAGWIISPAGALAGDAFFNSSSPNTAFYMPFSNITLTAQWNAHHMPAGTHWVSVIDSWIGAAASGEGARVPGSLVTINAGTRPFHRFSHWTVVWPSHLDMGHLFNSFESITTIVMPHTDVQIVANWVQTEWPDFWHPGWPGWPGASPGPGWVWHPGMGWWHPQFGWWHGGNWQWGGPFWQQRQPGGVTFGYTGANFPTDAVAEPGSSINFHLRMERGRTAVNATFVGQWIFDGQPHGNAFPITTDAGGSATITLHLPNITTSQTGSYSLRVATIINNETTHIDTARTLRLTVQAPPATLTGATPDSQIPRLVQPPRPEAGQSAATGHAGIPALPDFNHGEILRQISETSRIPALTLPQGVEKLLLHGRTLDALIATGRPLQIIGLRNVVLSVGQLANLRDQGGNLIGSNGGTFNITINSHSIYFTTTVNGFTRTIELN